MGIHCLLQANIRQFHLFCCKLLQCYQLLLCFLWVVTHTHLPPVTHGLAFCVLILDVLTFTGYTSVFISWYTWCHEKV